MFTIRTIFLAAVLMSSAVGRSQSIVPSGQLLKPLRQGLALQTAALFRGGRDVLGGSRIYG